MGNGVTVGGRGVAIGESNGSDVGDGVMVGDGDAVGEGVNVGDKVAVGGSGVCVGEAVAVITSAASTTFFSGEGTTSPVGVIHPEAMNRTAATTTHTALEILKIQLLMDRSEITWYFYSLFSM